MKKIFLILLVSLMAISLVFAAQGDSGQGASLTDSSSDNTQAGQDTGNGTQTNTEQQTQNQGEDTQLQNQVRIQSGNYENSEGKQMQIQNENGFKLKVGGVEAKSNMQISSEFDATQNRTMLKTQLSNGKNAEIKVMPDTASERAIERLQLKVCSSENSCDIELKEVGSGEQVKAAYEVKAQKEARVLGLFKTRMQVQAQVDAETGEVVQSKKPWWAFLAAE